MTPIFLRVAKKVYYSTGSPSVRQFYVDAVARATRSVRLKTDVNGIRYDLDLGELIDLNIFLRSYEPDVKGFLEEICKPGMVVADIGANIGAHALPCAQHVGPTGRVLAFEPTEYAFAKLMANLRLNSLNHVEPHQLAFSDQPGEAVVDFRASWRTAGGRKDGPCKVKFVRMDDWMAEAGWPVIDVMKIDVDGFEYRVMNGGRETLARSRPFILTEACSPHFERPGENLFEIFDALGYVYFDPKSKTRYPTWKDIQNRLPSGDEEMTVSVNVVAIPAEKLAQSAYAGR